MQDLIPGWLPPTRENWETLVFWFQLMCFGSVVQFATSWYGMGKTSQTSRFNLPGRLAWATMELPGPLLLTYTVVALSTASGTASSNSTTSSSWQSMLPLPWQSLLLLALYLTHYAYRALLAPLLLNPSMAPIHPLVWLMAAGFQAVNGTCIGAWIGAYGASASPGAGGLGFGGGELAARWDTWDARPRWVVPVGVLVWAAGFVGNVFHDEVLRDIRRGAARKKDDDDDSRGGKGKRTGKDKDSGRGKKKTKQQPQRQQQREEQRVYQVPERGLFGLVLYAHYFCEWVEWLGFWIIAGPSCVPARVFFVNEIITMLPRAWNGWYWYVDRFGREKIGNRKAVIPYLA